MLARARANWQGLLRRGSGLNVVAYHVCQPNGAAVFAAHIPAEFQVIGQDQVAERPRVTSPLIGFEDFLEVLANVFDLEMPDVHFAFADDEIRCAVHLAFGFVGGGVARQQGFEQVLQVAAVGVLGGITPSEFALKVSEVCGDGLYNVSLSVFSFRLH